MVCRESGTACLVPEPFHRNKHLCSAETAHKPWQQPYSKAKQDKMRCSDKNFQAVSSACRCNMNCCSTVSLLIYFKSAVFHNRSSLHSMKLMHLLLQTKKQTPIKECLSLCTVSLSAKGVMNTQNIFLLFCCCADSFHLQENHIITVTIRQ